MPPEINAVLERDYFALSERVALTLSVTNRGTEDVVAVADPRHGGDALRFWLRFPDGRELSFSIGDALQAPGVRQVPADMRVPPGIRQDLQFDLAALTRLEQPGSHVLRVTYQWSAGEPPYTAELPFVIRPPASRFLEATPAEASRAGYYGVLWTEPEDTESRVLLLDHRIDEPLLGGRQVAQVPMGATPALSTEPPGLPFSERWMAWAADGRVQVLYHADTVEHKLPVRSIPVPRAQRLVRPLLAEPAPTEGRPGCMIGVLTGDTTGATALVPVVIDGRGEAELRAPVNLPGTILEAWAVLVHPSTPMFIVATRVGTSTELLGITCPWREKTGPPLPLLATDAELVVGDVRPTRTGQVHVGVLLKRDRTWERQWFTLAVPGEPTIRPLRVGTDAVAVRARLDARGELHLLFRRGDRLQYLPPGEDVLSARGPVASGDGRSIDLLLPAQGPPTALLYDPERGPVALTLSR